MFRIRLVELGALQVLADNLKDTDSTVRKIGAWGERTAQRNLREQRSAEGPFEPRRVPNIPGIISDLNRGQEPAKRRWDPGPVPFDTGLLWKSIKAERNGPNSVRIGVTGPAAEYATIQHEGGESETETISKLAIDTLVRFLDLEDKRRAKRVVENDSDVVKWTGIRRSLLASGGKSAAYKAADRELRKARKSVRNKMAKGPMLRSEAFDELGWLADDVYVGKTLTVKVRGRPWLAFSDEDYEEAREDVANGLLGRGSK